VCRKALPLICAALGVLAAACDAPCTPGGVWVISGAEQIYSNQTHPIAFDVAIGTCRPGKIPVPKARAIGPSGSATTGSVVIEEREGGIAYGELEIVAQEPGMTRIELAWDGTTRHFDINYIDALWAPRDLVIQGTCVAPARLTSTSVTCTSSLYPGEAYAFESRDGGVTRLETGSRLWSTAEGYLVTADGGIGWLGAEQRLVDWAPQAPLSGQSLALAATSSAVFVLSRDSVTILSRTDLSALEQVIPFDAGLDVFPMMVASGSRLVVSTNDGFAYHRVEFTSGDAGYALTNASDSSSEGIMAAFGALYWTCSLTDKSLRAYQLTEDGPLLVLDSTHAGECTIHGYSDRPTLFGRPAEWVSFAQCPFLTDAGMGLASVDLGDEIPTCFDRYLLLNSRRGPPTTDFIDLSQLIRPALSSAQR
jgi:hypothetical protein